MATYTRPAGLDSSAVMWYDSDTGNIVNENFIVGGAPFDSADAISANVNIAANGVGSYAFLRYSRVNENFIAAGSTLSWAGNNGNLNTSSANILTWGGGSVLSLSGTWRQHGYTNLSAYNNGITVWKRIT